MNLDFKDDALNRETCPAWPCIMTARSDKWWRIVETLAALLPLLLKIAISTIANPVTGDGRSESNMDALLFRFLAVFSGIPIGTALVAVWFGGDVDTLDWSNCAASDSARPSGFPSPRKRLGGEGERQNQCCQWFTKGKRHLSHRGSTLTSLERSSPAWMSQFEVGRFGTLNDSSQAQQRFRLDIFH